MKIKAAKCIKAVYDEIKCIECGFSCVKNGISSGSQRYRCRSCGKSFLVLYKNKAYKKDVDISIKEHLKEGCGIRSISRLLKISSNTVLRRIKAIAAKITKPNISFGKAYEMDEFCTYVKSKSRKRWIAYAIRKDTKEVVDFSIGSRTNRTLRKVTDTLILSDAVKVFTDKLPNYKSLLPSRIHSTKYKGTNYIERKNLTLRTHLKRLNRRTICFHASSSKNSESWKGSKIERIALDEFDQEILNYLKDNNNLTNVYPKGNLSGFVVTVEEFVRDLDLELEKYL